MMILTMSFNFHEGYIMEHFSLYSTNLKFNRFLALFSCRLVSRPIFGPQEQGQKITGEINILTPYIIDLFCGLRNSIFHLRLVDKVTLQLQSPTTREVFLYIKCEPIPCPFTVFFFCQEGRLPFTCNLVSICRVVSYSSER